jgi:RNA polymerase sigma-54 factor
MRLFKELAKALNRPAEHVEIAVAMIRGLNPRPGIRFSGPGARTVEPDVYYIRDGDDFIIQMNDDELPQLRLNAQYKKMLERDPTGAPSAVSKDVRDYVRERYTSAIQLMKNIEQRKQTIIRVCEAIKRRQMEFLTMGIDALKPMMIKDVAEEVGVHPYCQPRRGEQIRTHSSRRIRIAILLLRSGAGPFRRRNTAFAVEA